SRVHARAVWGFIEDHLPRIERFIVHCDAGMCRSPAVAAAVAKVLLGDDAAYFRRYRPNMRGYRIMLETYYDEYDKAAQGRGPPTPSAAAPLLAEGKKGVACARAASVAQCAPVCDALSPPAFASPRCSSPSSPSASRASPAPALPRSRRGA